MPAMNGKTARLWLAMLREGGRSTSGEVAGLCDLESAETSNILSSMVSHGTARKFAPPAGKILGAKYGVTADCKVPIGVTISEIMACMSEAA